MPHENTIQDKVYIFPWKSLVMLKIHSFKNSSVFYMHIVIKCIGALDVSHNAHVNWPQQVPSQLGPLVAGGK